MPKRTKGDVEGTTAAQIKDKGGDGAAVVAYWLDEIQMSRDREKDYLKDANEACDIYEATKRQENQFNILYANTETLQPALYNQVPRPLVDRRYKDNDPLGKDCAEVTQRTIEYLADTNESDTTGFDELMECAVLDALVPGRGQTKFKYDAEVTEDNKVQHEYVCGEEIAYDRVHYGYARRWKEMPWIGYEWTFTPDRMVENFGKAIAAKVEYTEERNGKDDDHWGSRSKDSEGVKLCTVHEVWDRGGKQVLFVSPGYKDGPLKVVPDPFGLSGFFPQPRPLQFFRRTKSLIPTTLYRQYEDQAKELNRITMRINRLVVMLKARGAYDKRLEGLDGILQASDGVMKPLESLQGIGEAANIEKAIWMVPIDKIIAVLQQLYLQREQCKKIIFELTGLADIVRGSSAASESATAQQIKDRWGSVRLRRMQKAVQRYCRESYRILAELGVKKLSPQTLAAMTGLKYPTAQEKQRAQALLQAEVQAGKPPEQLDQRAQATMQQPSWEELLGALRNDLTRRYKIDIETNSTIDVDVTEDKKEIQEMMTALGGYMQSVAPLVVAGSLPFEAAKTMMLIIVRRYRFGKEIEDEINKMQPPKPQDDGAAAKAEVEKQRLQLEVQKQAHDTQMQQAEMAMKQKEAADKLALEKFRAELEAKLEREKAQMKVQTDLAIAKMQEDNKVALARAEGQRQTQLKREEIASNEKVAREKNAFEAAAREREAKNAEKKPEKA